MFGLFKKSQEGGTDTDSFKKYWIKRFEENRDWYHSNVTKDPCGQDWQRNIMPESNAEFELDVAIKVLYANADNLLAQQYLERCLQVVRRIEEEDRLVQLNTKGEGLFPVNRGRTYRTQAYALALLGRGLDSRLLMRASKDYEDYCNGEGKSRWDSQSQCYYLNAVTLALLAGSREQASDLLATPRSFKWHAEQAALYRELIQSTAEAPVEDAILSQQFDRFFDEVRNPKYNPQVYHESSLLRFELGALRDKYFLSQNGEIDWSRVIDAVSR